MYKTLVLSSVTYAHKAQSILSRAGIRSTIMRSAAVRAVKGFKREGDVFCASFILFAAQSISVLAIV